MKFVDEVTIEVSSGKGGPGCVSFRREIFVPRGGPDGGDGGHGGSVIFKTSTRLHSLLDLRLKTKYYAQDGDPGKNQNRSGADGEDLVLTVPPGTVIKTLDGHIIKDLLQDEEFVFLEGGLGGKGNPFYKSSVNQAPEVAQKGLPGKKATIRLELKLLADVGIIGFPNAGKSTLISHISSAHPKVADYPFTTLVPNLGVVRYNEERTFVVADMPGLIKGAHQGVGLGTRFLKHIERTKCFIHLVDASGMSGRDPIQDYKDINYELKMYDKQHEDDEDYRPLATRRQIVVLNKADVLSVEDQDRLRNDFFKKTKVVCLLASAATGLNLKDLVQKTGEMVFHGDKNEAVQTTQTQKAHVTQTNKKQKKPGSKTRKNGSQIKKQKTKVASQKTNSARKKAISKTSRGRQKRKK